MHAGGSGEPRELVPLGIRVTLVLVHLEVSVKTKVTGLERHEL